MPLPVPTLDDRTFEQLVAEGRSLIPRYAPGWTNHNVSDPGITLLELFAYFTETSIFELDQIPDEAIRFFLELMATCPPKDEPLADGIAAALRRMQEQERAVTGEELRVRAQKLGEQETPPVRRVDHTAYVDDKCGETGDPFARHPVVSLISIIPAAETTSFALEDRMFRALRERALLGTHLHVAQPPRVEITIRTTVVRRVGQALDPGRVVAEIARFLDPLTGGPAGTGWPLGRTVYVSELYQVLEGMPEVDHVEALRLEGPAGPMPPGAEGIDLPRGTLVKVPPNVVVDVSEPT